MTPLAPPPESSWKLLELPWMKKSEPRPSPPETSMSPETSTLPSWVATVSSEPMAPGEPCAAVPLPPRPSTEPTSMSPCVLVMLMPAPLLALRALSAVLASPSSGGGGVAFWPLPSIAWTKMSPRVAARSMLRSWSISTPFVLSRSVKRSAKGAKRAEFDSSLPTWIDAFGASGTSVVASRVSSEMFPPSLTRQVRSLPCALPVRSMPRSSLVLPVGTPVPVVRSVRLLPGRITTTPSPS